MFNQLNFKMMVNIVVCLVIFIFAIGCQSIPKAAQEQKNKETIQRFFKEVYSEDNMDVLKEVFAKEFALSDLTNSKVVNSAGQKKC